MTIRQSLLAILDGGPSYGYQLRIEFESRTGGTWPLNIGQVYSTLDRLERDGLVDHAETDDDGHVIYAITVSGHAEVEAWLASPVRRTGAARDELAIKLAMAVTMPGVDVPSIVQAQRTAALHELQDLTRLKVAQRESPDDLAWRLILEGQIFAVESEVRWLDHVESSLARARLAPRASARTQSAAPSLEETTR